MADIVDMFAAEKSKAVQADPNYNYVIEYKDGDGTLTKTEQTGYLVMNSLFMAICRGEGVVYWAKPFQDIVEVRNLGEAATGTAIN